MRTSGLSESEQQRLIGRLEGESQTIRLEFATLVHSTETELKQRNITPQILVQKLSYYDIALSSEVGNARSIEHVFSVTNYYWSFFNYDLLEYIITTLELSKGLLLQYIINFKEYCKRRLYECPSNVGGSYNESGRRIVLKIDDQMSVQRSTLHDLRRLQDQASKITGVNVMQLLKIEEGCLHLVYRIPHRSIEKINFLSPNQEQELKAIGILSITCEKKMVRWLIDGGYLKELVRTGKKTNTLLKKWATTAKTASHETEVVLSLSVTATHVTIDAVNDLACGVHLVLKVIPAIHYNSEAQMLPCTEISSKMQNFSIPNVITTREIAEAKADVFEFFLEMYVADSPPRTFSKTVAHAQNGMERMKLEPTHNTQKPRQTIDKMSNRNSLPSTLPSIHDGSEHDASNQILRSSSSGEHYLAQGFKRQPSKTPPHRPAVCIN
jgi:hypothetical protein